MPTESTPSISDLVRAYSNSVPILLLPPSEGKADGGMSHPWEPDSGAFSVLANHRDQVVSALSGLKGGSEKLLGVKGDHLARALSANSSLLGAPSLPAWQRYTGVVWGHLDPASLSAAERRRIIVISGLLGLARADDPIPDYRMKMGATLQPLGKLSTWWRDDLSQVLNKYAAGRTARSPRVLIDLLPKEHRAAWTRDDRVNGLSIEFVDPSGKPGGHFAKAAKGALARALLTDSLSALETWTNDRFELSVVPID
jgi:cytoplasmic iron level regulating protein YaaA (DUF328/UPF0246 family)